MVSSLRHLAASTLKATEFLGSLMVLALVLLLVGNIVVREVFGIPLVWANEVSLILFAWIVFLGSAVAFSKNSRIRFDFLRDKLPSRLQAFLERIANYIGIGSLITLLVIGIQFVVLNWDHRLTSLDASAAWQWACLPVGVFIALIGWFARETNGPERSGSTH